MRNKEITVLHSAKTGEWVDMKREEKVQMQLEKATWLKNILQECLDMDKHYNKSTDTGISEFSFDQTQLDLSLIGELEDKLKLNRLITKSDMHLCNHILKNVKRKYKFDIDWRGNIEGELYTQYTLNKNII